MKRILLIGCLLAAMHTIAFAQSKSTPPSAQAGNSSPNHDEPRKPHAVSKTEFFVKISELDNLMDKNDMVNAKNALEDLQRLMQDVYEITDEQLEEAELQKNADNIGRYRQIISEQRRIYNKIVVVKKTAKWDKAELRSNLKDFTNNIPGQ